MPRSQAFLKFLVLGFVGQWCLGCSISLVNDLDEQTATKVATALIRNGVAAEKSVDSSHDGRFAVKVGRDDASFALSVMSREQLPSSKRLSLAQSMDGGSFIASRDEEHARWLLGTSSELEISLSSMNQIITARVHLAVARDSILRGSGPPQPGQASVLLKYSGPACPLSVEEVQKLVAGAVPGLVSDHVAVVRKRVADLPARSDSELVRLGPLTTTRSSLPYFRWMIAAVTFLNICMVSLLIIFWRRASASTSQSTLDGNSVL